MTKLEQKLIELGYEIYLKEFNTVSKLAYKTINKYDIKLRLNKEITKIYAFGVVDECTELYINSQEQIDNLQQAFNIMQKDLEILKQ